MPPYVNSNENIDQKQKCPPFEEDNSSLKTAYSKSPCTCTYLFKKHAICRRLLKKRSDLTFV